MSNDYNDRQASRDRQYREEYREWYAGLPEEEKLKMIDMGLDEPHIDLNGVGAPELDEERISAIPAMETSPGDLEALSDEEGAQEGVLSIPQSLQDSLCLLVAEIYKAEKPDLTLAIIASTLRVPRCNAKRISKLYRKSKKWVIDESARMRFRLELMGEDDERVLRRIAGRLISTANAKLSLDVLALVSGICYRGISETEIASRHGISRAAVSKRCVEMTKDLGLPPSRAMKSEKSREVYREAQENLYGRIRDKGGSSGDFWS